MEKRRQSLFEEAKNFFEMQGGMPESWVKEIKELCPEDSFDALDIIVGHMCSPEWGGTTEARNFLSMIGATNDEIESLIAINCDSYF